MIRIIAAMRGRGGTDMDSLSVQKWNQQLELNTEGLCNSLTTASKDNLVLEIDDGDSD